MKSDLSLVAAKQTFLTQLQLLRGSINLLPCVFLVHICTNFIYTSPQSRLRRSIHEDNDHHTVHRVNKLNGILSLIFSVQPL